MSKRVLGWLNEISIPYHHNFISRWLVVLVDQSGRRLVDDWSFESRQEAENALHVWGTTHTNVDVLRVDDALSLSGVGSISHIYRRSAIIG
jgi:hypothetical protein